MDTIVYNLNNPASLKLVLANSFASAPLAVQLKQEAVASEYVPYLALNTDQKLFVSNAAIWYLFPPKNESAKVREILEIEASLLAPSLATLLGSNIKSDIAKKLLLSSINKLNIELKDKQFITNHLSVADVAIFSTLYPMFGSETLAKEYLSDSTNLTAYLNHLASLQQFQMAISTVFTEKELIGVQSYQVLAQSSKSYLPQTKQEKPSGNQSEPPKHEEETVSDNEIEAAKAAWNSNLQDLVLKKQADGVVLPEPGKKNIFITSSLPYVNNVPHLGNIIGCVLSADVFARYSRLCGNKTLYICGTDEYGTATETKALEEDLSCQAICDKYFKIHEEIYRWFNISFDAFGRTTTPMQTELVQDLFLHLNHNGFMFTQPVEQLHCTKCNRYLADRFVEGGCPNIGCNYEDARGDQCDSCGKLVNAVELKNPRCKICGNSPQLKTSHQFFIDLPKLEPLLLHWVKESSPGWSHNAEVIAKTWLKEGLKPRCITRDLKWGVPVPLDGYRDKVFYVWFDAPIGYMSISKGYTDNFEKWWRPAKDTNVTLYQFMAKDNVPFHAILFPAIMLGANRNYVTVSHIMATEYLNYEDGKFSKSRGIGVFGNDVKETKIPSDVWRFYLLYVRPEAQDSSFSWEDLATKNNSELLNNLGNFVNRALTFIKNNFNKTVPPMELLTEDFTLLALCAREVKGYIAALEKAKLRDGIRHILAISKLGNQYMQANQPWVKIKEGEAGKLRSGTIVGVCANLSCLLSILLHPYMPDTSDQLKVQLNRPDYGIISENPVILNYLPAGHQLGEPQPLFTKIEPELIEEYKKKFAGTQESRKSPPKENGVTLHGDVETLEEAVTKQGLVVRKLKEGGAEKSVWQPQVEKLLALKQQLAAATGITADKPKKGKSNLKKAK